MALIGCAVPRGRRGGVWRARRTRPRHVHGTRPQACLEHGHHTSRPVLMRGWNATVATAVTGDALLRLRAKMGTRRAEATAGEAAAAAAAAAGLGDAAAAAAAVAPNDTRRGPLGRAKNAVA